ncbi:hypothetical protein DDD63_07105 [Actinobaculum sp. 313]|nr:hypothetical protein DDD63_07105 [Actinobaculum sp. 313]
MNRAVWRLARRELTRHRIRSLFALLLVALPVAAISALGVVSTSVNNLQSQLEENVQATILYFGVPVHQDPLVTPSTRGAGNYPAPSMYRRRSHLLSPTTTS